MEQRRVIWTGDEWQAYCNLLLAARYKDRYQVVPDRHGGDCGIEGFTLDGHLYQCYAPEQSYDVKALYEHQRDKITTDIAKLVRHIEKIAAWLAPAKPELWVLLVPEFSSKSLLDHAAKKSEQIRRRIGAHLGAGFRLVIQTSDNFATERASLEANQAKVAVFSVPDHSRVSWMADGSNVEFLRNLDRKLNDLLRGRHRSVLDAHQREFVENYLCLSQVRDDLRRSYPSAYDDLMTCVNVTRSALMISNLASGDAPKTVKIGRAHQLLSDALERSLSKLPATVRSAIVNGVISEWLMHCDLDDFEAA